jgi:predicted transglutaminase-like cysteine proteinase
MPIRNLTARIVAAAFIIAASGTAASAATLVDFANPAFAPVLGPTSTPIGHAEFCKMHRDECGDNPQVTEAVVLTDDLWEQLVRTNNRMNTEIVPVTDADLYQVGEFWTYPDGYGDCEDFALAKRRDLIEQGWDASALLMAVVRESNGNGHAVLIVRTDRGDLVLDNQDSFVRLWNETPYQFIKRQSQHNAGSWVLIDDTRTVVSVASTN